MAGLRPIGIVELRGEVERRQRLSTSWPRGTGTGIGVSGAKSDAGDAHVLAELVRLDRAHHRPVAGDSAIAEHVRVLARAHQSLVWSRQRQTNMLRSMLREFYPGALDAFAGDLDGRDALAVLAIAPRAADGRRLSRARVETALRRAGRQRYVATRAAEIVAALRAD